MRRYTLTMLVAIGISAACGGSSATGPSTSGGTTTPTPVGTTPPTATTAVAMTGFQFSPASITVAPGTVVTWTNLDNTNHNVTFSSSAVTSIGNFTSGAQTTKMPQATGTYAYRCTIHAAMTGTVVVQ